MQRFASRSLTRENYGVCQDGVNRGPHKKRVTWSDASDVSITVNVQRDPSTKSRKERTCGRGSAKKAPSAPLRVVLQPGFPREFARAPSLRTRVLPALPPFRAGAHIRRAIPAPWPASRRSRPRSSLRHRRRGCCPAPRRSSSRPANRCAGRDAERRGCLRVVGAAHRTCTPRRPSSRVATTPCISAPLRVPQVDLKVNKLTSPKTHLGYDNYKLKFCTVRAGRPPRVSAPAGRRDQSVLRARSAELHSVPSLPTRPRAAPERHPKGGGEPGRAPGGGHD